jgi:putative ABC transport system permease protein
LDALGTNLLTVAPGQTMFGDDSALPVEAVEMIGRIGPVESVSAVGRISDARAYRNDRIPSGQSGGIAVYAARLDLLTVVGASMSSGMWLNGAVEQYPAVVLGSAAAQRLGVIAAGPDVQALVGGIWCTVVGVLSPVPLAKELDSAVLLGWAGAVSYLGFDGHPTTVYTRTRPDAVTDVQAVLGPTANPEAPSEVRVSRPSDALAAAEATDDAFTGLLLGLGAVALLVGGVGVANTMVISVLERRSEIGLRRSLGATRGQIRTQFLAESLLLSLLGGLGGVFVGVVVTSCYAIVQEWPTVVPLWATAGGALATLLIGAVAGLYPAMRAARLSPTEALAV